MKTIGLVGGLSWVSSLDYYRYFNEIANKRRGGNDTVRVILHSVNYGDIVRLTRAGDWDGILGIIAGAAKELQQIGAGCILLGANTMHHIADRVQEQVDIPLLHIADTTAAAIRKQQLKKVALLGTRYTMLFDFYKTKLAGHGIEAIIPDEAGIDFVNHAIYEELGKGIFLPGTKARFLQIIGELTNQGAQGAILGCTEIPMLIKQEDTPVPVFDTTLLHATAAVDFALGDGQD